MRIAMRLLLVLAALGTAQALEGVNGSVAASLFNATELATNTAYPADFDGVRWDDSSFFQVDFGLTEHGQLAAADSLGKLFLIVVGHRDRELGPNPRGLVGWDGAGFVHLVQHPTDYDSTNETFTRSNIWAVAVSPVTAGLLTTDHPVIVRETMAVDANGAGAPDWELWSVDPTTSPATETVVHRSSIEIAGLAIGASGDIYIHDGAVVMKLAFNGTDYDEEVLAYADLQWGQLALGGDGALYALEGNAGWGEKKGANDILRIDPDTGSTNAYASVSRKFGGCWALTGDSTGRLWIGLVNAASGTDIITEVLPGETIGTRSNPVSESLLSHTRTMAAGADGELYVAEWDSVEAGAATEVFELVPGSGGGSDGGGSGGGKGKGKNK